MEKIFNMMNDGATFFLDLPNSENINFEDYIFEEYFVEKHKYNFMLEDVLNILIHSGISIDIVSSDPFNLTVIGKKRSGAKFELANIKGSDSKTETKIIS